MTELGYRPDQTPLGAQQERFVFTPEQRPHLEFDIRAAAERQGRSVGADSPEIYKALEDAHQAAQQAKEAAAARTPEHGAEELQLAQAIKWNAEAIVGTRDFVETNGF